PGIFLAIGANARVGAVSPLQDFGRAVGRSVVDHDRLDGLVRLPEHTVDGARQAVGPVVGWNDYRHQRIAHEVPTCSALIVAGGGILSQRSGDRRVVVQPMIRAPESLPAGSRRTRDLTAACRVRRAATAKTTQSTRFVPTGTVPS